MKYILIIIGGDHGPVKGYSNTLAAVKVSTLAGVMTFDTPADAEDWAKKYLTAYKYQVTTV